MAEDASTSIPPKAAPRTIFTVGHSTRSLDELVQLLQDQDVGSLVDIRTIPRSRTNPQHNEENLRLEQPRRGLRYEWLGRQLGGLRKRRKELGDVNGGWENASFQGYADYMQTPEFAAGVEQLESLAREAPVALMCAEVVHWRCHRSLLSDALAARGWHVRHITAPGKAPFEHKMTMFARVEGTSITYPPYDKGAAARREAAAEADAGQRRIDTFFSKTAKASKTDNTATKK